VSLKLGIIAPSIGLILGTILGFLAAWRSGWVDWWLSAINDAVFALPGIAIVAVAVHSFEDKELTIIVSLGLLSIPAFARMARNIIQTHKQRSYVLTARMAGGSPMQIFLHLILPNIRRTLFAYALLVGSMFIVLEGSLSFLGLGIPAPQPSWGSMIAEGRESFSVAPHTLIIPVIVLTVTVLAFNAIGEVLKGEQ
jgi:peptide/nickel transport system permease protein